MSGKIRAGVKLLNCPNCNQPAFPTWRLCVGAGLLICRHCRKQSALLRAKASARECVFAFVSFSSCIFFFYLFVASPHKWLTWAAAASGLLTILALEIKQNLSGTLVPKIGTFAAMRALGSIPLATWLLGLLKVVALLIWLFLLIYAGTAVRKSFNLTRLDCKG
jgi:hypothetical protein